MDFDKTPDETAKSDDKHDVVDAERRASEVPLAEVQKSRWERSWPVFACGAGLFSDGRILNIRTPGPVQEPLTNRTHLQAT